MTTAAHMEELQQTPIMVHTEILLQMDRTALSAVVWVIKTERTVTQAYQARTEKVEETELTGGMAEMANF